MTFTDKERLLMEVTIAPFMPLVKGGNFAPLFRLAVQNAQTQNGGHFCSFGKPAGEVVTEPNQQCTTPIPK